MTNLNLPPLASRFVDVPNLPWEKTRFPGIEQKTLLIDKATGLVTALMKMAPGVKLPDHQHVKIEQTFVLEGSLCCPEGECHAGQFVWRPAGSRHHAWAGAKGGLSALNLVKQAKGLYESALKLQPDALDGSAYNSLGVLYYKVPGWPVGFGDPFSGSLVTPQYLYWERRLGARTMRCPRPRSSTLKVPPLTRCSASGLFSQTW